MRTALLFGWTAVVTGAQICHVLRHHAVLGLYNSRTVSWLHGLLAGKCAALIGTTLLVSAGTVEVFAAHVLLGDSLRTSFDRHDHWTASRPDRCLASFPCAGLSATLLISIAAEVAIAGVGRFPKDGRAL